MSRTVSVEERVVRAVCPHDCPDTCAMLVSVRDGRAVRVAGDPQHPFTSGVLCSKVVNYQERTHSSDRLLFPLRRTGPKGSGEFARITWNEALDEIAAKFRTIAASEDGAEAILPYSYGGTLGLIQGRTFDRRFFARLGASILLRTICSTAGDEAIRYTIGAQIGTDPEMIGEARMIVIWGSNVILSNLHLWPFILKARKHGARIITIDPYRTQTAEQSDVHVQILPGTDAALALGMMHVIFAEGLEDREYLERHCIGGEALRHRVCDYPPSRVAAITRIPEEEIVLLAREYAREQPSFIRLNYGMQRHAGGGSAVRAVACLPAVVGAWRHAGGGLLLSTSGAYGIDSRVLERPDLRRGNPRSINMSQLGDALLAARPPIKALYVYNSNPAAVAPDQSQVTRGLLRDDLFTVVHEQFLTDTAHYADIVLPATTQLEHFDVMKSYGHLYLMVNEPAVAPLGEAKRNSEVFRLLAERMGFDDAALCESDHEVAEKLLATHAGVFGGITLDRLREQGWCRLDLPKRFAPFAQGGFRTPSGKCEIYSEALAHRGLDPLPGFVPPNESRISNPALAAKYPLALISPPAPGFLNTTFGNLPRTLRMNPRPVLDLHPDDAEQRGIAEGMEVLAFNDRGSCTLTARISDRVPPGVVVAPSTWWRTLSPEQKNINQLTGQGLTDLGEGATFYDCLVQVERQVTANTRHPISEEVCMAGQMIKFASNGATAEGYLAIPPAGKGPGVIVIQEWWGLVPHIKKICDRFAAAGYVALAPDLYHGESTKSPDQAGKLMMALNIDAAERDLAGAASFVLGHEAVTSKKVGTVGFCMGGALSLYAATQNPKVGACVVFYGGHPSVRPDLPNLHAAMLGLYAERDGFVTPESVRELEKQLRELGKQHEIHIYPGADHGFFNDERPEVFNEAAAKDAWGRVLEFYQENLK